MDQPHLMSSRGARIHQPSGELAPRKYMQELGKPRRPTEFQEGVLDP